MHPNALINKEKIKKLFFNILRKKLSFLEENYLLTILNWIEKESNDNSTQNKKSTSNCFT